jgi:hypothetical protein
MTSTRQLMLTANVEDGVSSKDTEDAFLEEESEEDNKEDCNGEEDQHGPNREPQNDVLDGPTLRKYGKKCASLARLKTM